MTIDPIRLTAILVVTLGLKAGSADTLALRSGQQVEGTFVGGTTRQINFVDTTGRTHAVGVGDVAGITFAAPPPPPPPPPPRPAAAPAASVTPTTVPAGTMLSIRLIDGIDVDAAQAGQTFRASVDDPVMIGGNTVIPRGADATLQAAAVKQAGRFKGSDEISLKINTISFAGRKFDVVTEPLTQKSKGEGKKTARRTAGIAGLGAAIGGIAGGGSGAAIGAAAGAATGVAASAGGQHMAIPSETRLQFTLASAVTIR